MEPSDIISCCTLVLSVLGAIGAFVQWRKVTKIRRAEFVKIIYDKFNDSDIVRRGVYLLDYEQDWYGETFHNSTGERSNQVAIDATLSYLSYICYLKITGVIDDTDFLLFKYVIDRALNNCALQDYFYNLYHFSHGQDTEFPFPLLLRYAENAHIFPHEFFDKDACLFCPCHFSKVLNF